MRAKAHMAPFPRAGQGAGPLTGGHSDDVTLNGGVRAHLLPPARHPVVIRLVALGGELVLLHDLEHS